MLSNTHRSHTQRMRGIGLIEAVVVMSVMSVAFAGILTTTSFFLRDGLFAADRAQALFLLEEGIEAMRFLRDNSYTTNITPYIGVGARYLDPAGSSWSVTGTNTPIFGKYTRTITLASVYRRNSDDDIIPSTSGDPKTIDPNTAYLTVTVSWAGRSESQSTYIANLYEN